mgnify:CR=1 FL=1
MEPDPDPERLYYGKGFVYPLFAAPFIWLFGTNGFLVLHADDAELSNPNDIGQVIERRLLLGGRVLKEGALAPASRIEPEVLANIPPTPSQRRMASAFLMALLVVLLGTWPFAAIRLPEVPAFVPTLAAALFVSDCVTAALLFAQFSILRQWALLVIASGYLFSGLIVVAHALTFPGAFTPTGVLGSGLQSAVWLYWFWHAGLPLAIIGYALLKTRIVWPTSASRDVPSA